MSRSRIENRLTGEIIALVVLVVVIFYIAVEYIELLNIIFKK